MIDEPYDTLESIDAMMFSGDTFHNQSNVIMLEMYMKRWARQIRITKENNDAN